MGSPLAKHVPLVLTVLLVPQVVLLWIQLLVVLEPMPVGQQPFVIYVLLGNTTIKQVKRLVQRVHYVPVVLIAMLGRPVVSLCTRNARVASVATVLVKVK